MKVYQKSDVIFEENSVGNEMYVIRSGKVKLVLGGQGQGVEVGTLEPGEYFGEMALIDSSPRSATAISVEDNTELEVLNRDGFLQMLRDHPEFGLDIMRELSSRVRRGNILYFQVIREAMAPYCPRNCLKKTMDAFTRTAILRAEEELGREGAQVERWKCGACDYIYDARMGDPSCDIQPGALFRTCPRTGYAQYAERPRTPFRG